MGWIPSGGTSLTVAESDGTPSVSGVSTILVSNTTLTDNTGGSVTIAMTPAGGANTALSNLASVAINASLVPGADGSLNLGTAALRFGTAFGGTAFSIYKAASEANPTATLGNGVLNFGAGTANAVDVGLKRSGAGVLYVTDGSSGQGDLNAHGLVIADTTVVTNLNSDTVDGSHAAAFANVALSNLASVAINAAVNPGADNSIAIGTSALRFTTISASTGFSIYKAASEANPTATLGNGVLNFGAGTTNAVDVGLKRSSGGVLYVTDGSSGAGDLNAHGLVIADTTMVTNLNADTVDGYHGTGLANINLSNIDSTAIPVNLETAPGVTAGLIATAPGEDTAAQAGVAAQIRASDAVAGTVDVGAEAGGSVYIWSGAAARLTSGNANGGDIILTPGAGIGTGVAGKVVVGSTSQRVDIAGLRFDPTIYAGYWEIQSDALGQASGSGPRVELYQGALGSYGPGLSVLNSAGDTVRIGFDNSGSGSHIHGVYLSATSQVSWGNASIAYEAPGVLRVAGGGDDNANLVASTKITAVGSAAYNGVIRTGVYKRAWTNAEVVALGAVDDAELKIATLPAKTIVRNAYIVVDTRETHLSDLTVALGRAGATYIDYIVASDADVSAESLGSELVTNGTFTGNATGWTLGGGGGTPDWFYDTDKVSHAADSAVATLTPTTPLVAVIGTQYKLTWTMAHTSGTGVTASFGGVSGTQRASSATFNEYFTATSTATLTFTPTANWVGSVDTVILKEVARTVYGDLVTERGTNLTGYDLPSYTTTTDVYLNFVTTDGGHTLADALQCTGTVYITTEILP